MPGTNIHQWQQCCRTKLSSATVPSRDGMALRTLMRCSACQSAGTWEHLRTAPLARGQPSALLRVRRGFLCKELRALSEVAARGICLAHNPRSGSCYAMDYRTDLVDEPHLSHSLNRSFSMQTTALGYLEFESLTHQRPDPGVLRHGSADPTLKTSGGEDAIPATITTTLYGLIEALQDVVQPGEDALVVATMVHLLCTGRITLLSGIEA